MFDSIIASDDAPLFSLFWENSALTLSRRLALSVNIEEDAATQFDAYRPSLAQNLIPLEADSNVSMSLAQATALRQSTREFGNVPLNMAQLSQLFAPFSIRPDGHRSMASGGGKYPINIYTLNLHLSEPALNNQISWFDSLHNGLRSFGNVPSPNALIEICGIDLTNPPAMIIFLIGRINELAHKYGERGGRFMLIEAGAHLQMLELQVAALGLAGYAIGAFLDKEVLDMLNLSANSHQAILAYAVGNCV